MSIRKQKWQQVIAAAAVNTTASLLQIKAWEDDCWEWFEPSSEAE